jgi:hypothetical protein
MKVAVANDAYQQQLVVTNGQRREYYTMQLPRILGVSPGNPTLVYTFDLLGCLL